MEGLARWGSLPSPTVVPVVIGVGLTPVLRWRRTRPLFMTVVAFPVRAGPVLLHIAAAVTFRLPGALQFAPGFRRRHRAWHRRAGRVLVGCGLVVAATGWWMHATYPLPPGDGPLLMVLRYLFAGGMVVAIAAGFVAIRRGRLHRHRAWMMRGYAIGQGAGTQAVLLSTWALAVGPTTELSRAVLMGASWTLNLLVAEWLIRRRHPAGDHGVPPDDTVTAG